MRLTVVPFSWQHADMQLTEQVAAWHSALLDSREAQQYLSDRGLPKATWERFWLGYKQDDPVGIVIPYRAANGKVITAKMRRVGEGKPKYLTVGHDFPLPAPRRHIYNARVLLTADRVFVTEGEFDCMVLDQLGLAAVSIPGVSSFEDAWIHLFRGCDVQIAFDGDDPGKEAAAKLGGKFSQHYISNSILQLPEGKDITDLYLDGTLEKYL
jgi:DNA primase